MAIFCDFALLTVVPEAWEAAKELFEIQHFDTIEGYTYGFGIVRAQDGGQHVVAIAQCTTRSNIPAGHAATAMLETTRPRHLVVADIGGGFYGKGPTDRDGLKLGDIVVGNDIQYFEVEKITPDGSFPRDYAIALPSPGPCNTLTHLKDLEPGWYEPASSRLPRGAKAHIPKILDGQIVAGEKLLADPEDPLVARLVNTYDKALAVDMESGGVGGAVLDQQRKEIFAQFTVIRGISDFFDKKEPNQAKRNIWKPYAARVALAAARAWIGRAKTHTGVVACGLPVPPQLAPQLRHSLPATPTQPLTAAKTYIKNLRSWLATEVPRSERGFRLALLSTRHRSVPTVTPEPGSTVERGEVLSTVLMDRKMAVVGPSGAGKSNLLRQVLRQAAAEDDPLPIYLDLKKNWKEGWTAALAASALEAAVEQSLDVLLNASEIDVTASDLLAIANDQPVLIIVDAMNEVGAEVAANIRGTLDQCIRHYPNVNVLVSDRRAGEFYRESRWSVLHLDGVTEGAANDIVDEAFGEGIFRSLAIHDQKLLRLPFFLDRAVRSGKVHLGSRATAVHEYLNEAGLGDDEINQIAPVAFRMYMRGVGGPTGDTFEDLPDTGIVAKLRDAEIVTEGVTGQIFSHQLVHQFLAGLYLGSHTDEWTASTLDKVTSDAASPDTVGMTIASIPEIAMRDQFLRVVYDWNWRAAILALIEAQVSARPVSDALAAALLALAADKRFDAVKGSRERVEGLLTELPEKIVRSMRDVPTRLELRAHLAATDFPEIDWWANWRDIFLWDPEHHELTSQDVALIGSPEPLVGWTVSNGIRNFPFSRDIANLLHGIYRSQKRNEPGACATRWRVVHAVGPWATRENAEFLLECFSDQYPWVVYGAVRSLVELAALADGELRGWVLDQLTLEASRLPPDALSQVPWAAAYRGAKAEWPETVRPVLEAIRDQQVDGERDRWDRRMEAFDAYASEHDG